MDLEYRDDDRRRGRITIVVGVALAIAAAAAAYYVVSQAQTNAQVQQVQRVPAVVALNVIPARQTIEAKDVTIRQVPVDETNANGIATDVNQVIGRIPAVTILQNQLVTTNMLSSSTEGAPFSILGPEETIAPDSEPWRAISITVPDDLAVAGLLSAGQTVDVLVTAVVQVPDELRSTGKYISERSTKVTYQDMVILARKDAFYVLKATLPVAEEINHMQATGQVTFSLALRPDVDQRMVDASRLGETINTIIQKYGLPIPQPLGAGPRPPGPTPAPSIAASPSAEAPSASASASVSPSP
jgi:Flp pilus assembly protein CpaB